MTTATYQVTGMTCEHCTRAVTSELTELDGVSAVSVDLVPGGVSAVTVTSAAPLAGAAVSEALDEAGGYRLAGPGDAGDSAGPDGPSGAFVPVSPARSLPLA